MSGGDSQWAPVPGSPGNYFTPAGDLGISKEDLDLFSSHDSESAQLLTGVRRAKFNFGSSLGQQGYLNASGNPLDTNAVDAAATAFTKWKQGQTDSANTRQAYVDASNRAQGRAATILVPMSGPESKTILGANQVNGKTVLG